MKDTDAFQIRDLGPDDRITEPGFYRMPMARHHGQPCCTPDRLKEITAGDSPRPGEWAVTSSVLRTLEIRTPADHYAFSLLNPNRWPDDDRPALRMGRAMAALVEGGPEELERHFFVLPANKPKRPTADQIARYKAGNPTEAGAKSVEFWQKVEADPRDAITEDQWELLCNMGKVLAADPLASAALGGEPEITMAWYDEATDLWCLARPDQVSMSGMLSDYKKLSTQGRPFHGRLCDHRITDHAYEMQMAFACEAFEEITGNHPDQVGLVFQSDAPPHHVILRAIDEEDLRMADFRNKRARRLMRECMDSGDWWGPGRDVGIYHRPQWQREQLLEEMQTAGGAP